MVLVDFRGAPIRVTGTGASPDDDDILDLGLYFSSLTLLVTLLGLENVGGGSTSVVVSLETAMDPKGVWIAVNRGRSVGRDEAVGDASSEGEDVHRRPRQSPAR